MLKKRKLVETFDTNNDKLIEVEEIINSKRDEWKSFARSLDSSGLIRCSVLLHNQTIKSRY